MESILDKLYALNESDFYPYHMPGHKRNGNSIFSIDITEIDGFDNMHRATGIIKDAQRRAAELYGAKESFFLVNGSTCGLLSAICASFQSGDKVLVARNCHKAVYHALELRGIKPVYIYPETDIDYDISVGITAKQVEEAIKCEPKGMILTSPTYEGLISEVKEIAELLHRKDMILIVDEAHGAHFGFHPAFPVSAVTQGADLVIQSLHKTLPSMTQTALLHRCSDRVSKGMIQKYLGIFQTSSPSYVFMAYMDECIRILEKQSNELFQAFYEKLEHFYKSCENLKNIKVYQPQSVVITSCNEAESLQKPEKQYCSDPGKVVISAKGLTGKELYNILRQRFHLQPEMCAGNYVLAIMTICDTDEGFTRLYEALEQLDKENEAISSEQEITVSLETSDQAVDRVTDTQKTLVSLLKERPIRKYLSREVEALEGEILELKEAAGMVSKEYIYLYPPGIPFIVPGEVISDKVVKALINLKKLGYELQGPADETGKSLTVVKE